MDEMKGKKAAARDDLAGLGRRILGRMDKRFDAVDKRFNAVDGRLDAMDDRFSRSQQNLAKKILDVGDDVRRLRAETVGRGPMLTSEEFHARMDKEVADRERRDRSHELRWSILKDCVRRITALEQRLPEAPR